MNMNKKYIIKSMKNSFQIENRLTVFQHGIDVWKETKKIIHSMKNNSFEELPVFFKDNKDLFLKNIVDYKTLMLYCIYHDCGKPFCVPDHQIKFKDHEFESFKIIKELFPENETLHKLVLNDMKIHKVRACNFDDFLNTPNLITHIIVGLAEMNANSQMFGGKESDSYKMKYKNLY